MAKGNWSWCLVRKACLRNPEEGLSKAAVHQEPGEKTRRVIMGLRGRSLPAPHFSKNVDPDTGNDFPYTQSVTRHW